jgi:hypothetical protein
MAKRWAAAALLATEKNFRKVMGHKHLWALKAILDGKHEKQLDRRRRWRSMLVTAAQRLPTNCGPVPM